MFGFELLGVGGPAGDAAVGLGAAAAVFLLLGGPIALRAQRQRHQFQLAKTAIEHGAAQYPSADLPAWLQSMRAGVLTLTLGIALLITGAGSYWLSTGATMPSSATMPADAAASIPGFPPPRPPRPDPVDERWHESRVEKNIGLTAIGGGIILAMLGVARISFSRIERHHEIAVPARTAV